MCYLFYFVLLVFFSYTTYQFRCKIPIHLQGCADMIPYGLTLFGINPKVQSNTK